GAAVLPDNKCPATFPTNHFLYQSGSAVRVGPDFEELLGEADVVLALDHVDPAGTLRAAHRGAGDARQGGASDLSAQRARLINVSLDELAVRSWTTDFQELPPADLPILANTERFVSLLLPELRRIMADDRAAATRAEVRRAAFRSRREKLEAAWR
ncbi:MAG: hypothetical protein ACYDAG_10290, partial [Chloroflexota bacterium]